MKFYTYDLEAMPNFFSFAGKFFGGPDTYTFEISARRNQRTELLSHLSFIQNTGAIMVGYNSLGFDYPIIHDLLTAPYTFGFDRAYQMCREIIDGQTYGTGGPGGIIRPRNRIIPQLDLMKLCHFDNKAKRTRLKDLQFAMRTKSLEDLPYPFDQPLTSEQMDEFLVYNVHDITETENFLKICLPLIEMRSELLETGVLGGDVLNYNDVKIGIEYLVKKIGRAKCFAYGSTPNQSKRTQIDFKNIILPQIEFKTEPFQAVHEWFKKQSLNIENRDRPSLETKLANLNFSFGIGGVHASVEGRHYKSNETHIIKDIDVAGMYVAVANSNGFAPEHLGVDFTNAYRQLQRDRAQHPKGTSMNAVLKLAGNGVYGNSNNPHSCFYDPKYTFSVTVNGQLQLLQLVEAISLVPGVEIIQANTDGVTVYMPKEIEHFFDMWCRDWEDKTKLKLEEILYSDMWIRDVNNYMARTTDGKMKSKGAYWFPKSLKEYEGWWSKDFSNMSAQKVVEQVHLHGWKVEDVLSLVTDPFDFMLRYKARGSAKVYVGEKETSRTCRYYVSKSGEPMKKIAMPKGNIGDFKRKNKLTDGFYNKVLSEIPEGAWSELIHTKNKSKYAMTVTGIQAGRLVKECNDASKFNWGDVDFDYYAEEIKKLVIGDQHV
jgi:hypothetical protein